MRTPARIALKEFTALGFALLFCLSAPPTAKAIEVEKVPGLTAKGGAQRIGEPLADGKEFKEFTEELTTQSSGTFQFWTWLEGDGATLEFLKAPGILPITHELVAFHALRSEIVDVTNLGLQRTRQPGWRTTYLDLLAGEVNKRRSFISSALSRSGSSLPPASNGYRLQFRTSSGKLLAGANGRPLFVPVTLPR